MLSPLVEPSRRPLAASLLLTAALFAVPEPSQSPVPIVALVTDDAVETGTDLATVYEAGIDEKSFPQCDDVERGARIERDRLALREACETFSEPSPWSRQPY